MKTNLCIPSSHIHYQHCVPHVCIRPGWLYYIAEGKRALTNPSIQSLYEIAKHWILGGRTHFIFLIAPYIWKVMCSLPYSVRHCLYSQHQMMYMQITRATHNPLVVALVKRAMLTVAWHDSLQRILISLGYVISFILWSKKKLNIIHAGGRATVRIRIPFFVETVN